MNTGMIRRLVLLTVASLATSNVPAAGFAPPDGRIGYVMTNLFWSVYQTPDGKQECPKGYNDGPREQFAVLFPDHENMTVEETQLKQEIETWHPTTDPDPLPFYDIEGKYSYGLNLDDEIGPNDFTHPDGTEGIDNEVYRAVGCIIGFRGPDGVEVIFQDKAITDRRYNRMMIELSGVDDLENDDEVTVSMFRGRDLLLTDATGLNAMPGGSQRVDMRWGASLVRRTTGRITDGVLTTEPVEDMVMPWMNLSVPTVQIFRDARFKLELTPTSANGLLAGYADVETYYKQLIRNDSTHHLSNGQISGISLYKALSRLADAYPDPETGANTAISTSLDVKMVQVYIVHPPVEAGADLVTRSRDP
jgi:hypothetical protein